MHIGMVGLGRMGASMATRLLRGGHHCVVYDRHTQDVERMIGLGATGTGSLQQLVDSLPQPRAVPAGANRFFITSASRRFMPML